jgi:hypothetical protein
MPSLPAGALGVLGVGVACVDGAVGDPEPDGVDGGAGGAGAGADGVKGLEPGSEPANGSSSAGALHPCRASGTHNGTNHINCFKRHASQKKTVR